MSETSAPLIELTIGGTSPGAWTFGLADWVRLWTAIEDQLPTIRPAGLLLPDGEDLVITVARVALAPA